jgi:4-diphosphocytidyl-2-C-methyl-D-erythritol kinase
MRLQLLAPAKINPRLIVGERLQNGYHDVDTVMQAVSLFDEVSIEETDGAIRITVDGEFAEGVPTDERNICYKAAKIFCDSGIHIHIKKNIPHGAGLGGGSSDAAAAVMGLTALKKGTTAFSEHEVAQLELICCELGADVPFFIRGGLRRCTGIGMDLSDCSFEWGCEHPRILIAKGKESISTAAAYELIDRIKPVSDDENYFNSFDKIIQNGEINEIKHIVKQSALHYLLSGSGTAVFGVYDSTAWLLRTKKILRERGYFAASCEPVACGSRVTWAQI